MMTARHKSMLFACGAIAFTWAGVLHAFSWAPVNPDELKMTVEPKAPGAPAIILEKQVDRDDRDSNEMVYVRIKVLTDEGRKFGNIEIRYNKNFESISSIQARTINPGGKIIDFNGQIFDQAVIKNRGGKYQAKTLSLPEVGVGSIVEYSYTYHWSSWYVYDSQWILQENMFLKHGKYSLFPYEFLGIHWSWPRGLPVGTEAPRENGRSIELETHDVPAFVVEDYMAPENELKYRVDFVYHKASFFKEIPAKYWQKINKMHYGVTEEFMNRHRAMKQVMNRIVQTNDTNEEKLKKLYRYVQQLRNLSFEKRKTQQELDRERIRGRENVADVEEYGYGTARELAYLYVALARATGFRADVVYVSSRDRFFFQPELMNSNHLNSVLAVITLDGKEIYVEPGVPYVPFGLVPWYDSGVSGLRINKDNGVWIKVPVTRIADAQTHRKARLEIEDGNLMGTVTVTYTGLDAIYHRLEERYDDEVARKEYLQDEIKRVISVKSEVTVGNAPDWTGVDTPFVVEYKIKIPGWVLSAGKRMLLPIGLFGNDEKHMFEQERRIHPIYFHYPNIVDDEITIEVPSGWQVLSSPKGRDANIAWTTFSSDVETKNAAITIKRNLAVNGIYMPEKYYLALREFYQNVRANDEEQIILAPALAPVGADLRH